jgi:hypothetical protein
MSTQCSINVPSMLTQRPLNDHSLLTRCSLFVHSLFTHCSLNVHSVITQCSLNDHSMFKVSGNSCTFTGYLNTWSHHVPRSCGGGVLGCVFPLELLSRSHFSRWSGPQPQPLATARTAVGLPLLLNASSKAQLCNVYWQYMDSILTVYWQQIGRILTMLWQDIDNIRLDSILTV